MRETKETKTTKRKKDNKPKVPIEEIRFLTAIFHEIRTENYMHDYTGDYKLIGQALKTAKDYDMVKLMRLMEYFRNHGIKEVTSMQGWLIWAFKNPDTAMQPYNTIDLQNNRKQTNNARRNASRATEREYYDKMFDGSDLDYKLEVEKRSVKNGQKQTEQSEREYYEKMFD